MITPSFSLTATERVLPRLALDFTTASLDSRVTFTRTGNTATVINSSGLVQVVNADIPRFDYTLNTGGPCKGLLIEESRTNIITYSEDFSTGWGTTSGGTGSLPVITTNQVTAPDGTLSADKIVFNAGAGTTSSDLSLLQKTMTVSAVSYATSIYLRGENGGEQIMIQGPASNTYSVYTLTTSWQRISFVETGFAGTGVRLNIGIRQGLGGIGTVNANPTIYIWGAQMEAGAFATSYIPTVASQVTRNADVATMTGTNFSDWYNSLQGAFSVNFQTYIPALQSANILAVQGPAGANMTIYSDGGTWRFRTSLANMNLNNGISQNGLNDHVFTYATSDYKFAGNGTPIQTNTGVGAISGLDTLYVGAGTNYGAAKPINGWVSKISFWPQRITNNEVVAFSKL